MTRKYFRISSLLFLLSAVCVNAQSDTLKAVVSPDKMNVLYIGVDNPVSIAVPGIAAEKVSADFSKNGTLKQISPGYFFANVTEVDYKGETEIQVYVVQADSSKKLVGSRPFRVKRIPDPVVLVGNFEGAEGGEVKWPNFYVQRGIYAYIPNMDFDVRFNVLSYDMTIVSKKQKPLTFSSSGPLFTNEMTNALSKTRPGVRVIIDKISVKGPDGSIRTLKPVAYHLI